MTQLSQAKGGKITPEMKFVAEQEGCSPEHIRKYTAEGKIVIPKNIKRKFEPKGIGKGLRTKVNANIGTSPDHIDPEEELNKLKVALACGADSVMDLSTGGNLKEIRKAILENSCVMVGSVPIYEVAAVLSEKNKNLWEFSSEQLFGIIEKQCEDGIDFITVHCGITERSLEVVNNSPRIGGIVSRGGSILAAWIKHNKKENPLYENFDRLLEIVFKYDVTLSLGDGLRPGAIADASDKPQMEELIIMGELVKRAREKGVQVMIEGPGHVPINQIKANVIMEKRICDEAPFYVLGPLTTDIAPGYDHITSAIGGAIAAASGADFLCYVTPAEHLKLPDLNDIREGVIAVRIAAHTGDIAKGIKGAVERDIEMSKKRKILDWEGMYELAIDPYLPRKRRKESENFNKTVCTMCGKLCAIDLLNTAL
ncbi:MAG: phosphomethylpyrimidine synthase ThiC [Spirochaetes bacterium]|nr:phosphomethylpyrimidine synthase ThiC [Spirochaetota bacterium]